NCASEPRATTSTRPSARLETHPTTWTDWACRTVNQRKPTPWTRPPTTHRTAWSSPVNLVRSPAALHVNVHPDQHSQNRSHYEDGPGAVPLEVLGMQHLHPGPEVPSNPRQD